jgi:hypothetical protein
MRCDDYRALRSVFGLRRRFMLFIGTKSTGRIGFDGPGSCDDVNSKGPQSFGQQAHEIGTPFTTDLIRRTTHAFKGSH